MNAPTQTRQSPRAAGSEENIRLGGRRNHNTTTSPFERLLAAHESTTGYREQRKGKGARITCAACGTKAYKVATTEAADGTVLLHAFCGHAPHEVLQAIGLTVSELFVRRDHRTMLPAERSELRQVALYPKWRAALEVLTHEANVLLIAASKLGDGFALDDDELTRMRISALKVFDAGEVLNAR
jgi:hypothetical protein